MALLGRVTPKTGHNYKSPQYNSIQLYIQPYQTKNSHGIKNFVENFFINGH